MTAWKSCILRDGTLRSPAGTKCQETYNLCRFQHMNEHEVEENMEQLLLDKPKDRLFPEEQG